MKRKKLILITGPTASGKTSLAIKVARRFHTSIISADSRQCFREMNIGVAKPTAEELAAVKHYFINSHSIHDNVNAVVFAEYAQQALDEIFTQNDVAVMAGGTGLYIRAFTEGLDDIPDIDPEIRSGIIQQYETNGMPWLQDQLQSIDPAYYAKGEMQNPQRMMRALEVKQATGKSILEFQKRKVNAGNAGTAEKKSPYDIIKYAIDVPRAELYSKINLRVDQMMEDGLLDEVKSLLRFRQLNALQTVGYSELFEYLDGNTSLASAIEKIKQNTRRYAKRQLTWLRKETDIHWLMKNDAEYQNIA